MSRRSLQVILYLSQARMNMTIHQKPLDLLSGTDKECWSLLDFEILKHCHSRCFVTQWWCVDAVCVLCGAAADRAKPCCALPASQIIIGVLALEPKLKRTVVCGVEDGGWKMEGLGPSAKWKVFIKIDTIFVSFKMNLKWRLILTTVQQVCVDQWEGS